MLWLFHVFKNTTFCLSNPVSQTTVWYSINSTRFTYSFITSWRALIGERGLVQFVIAILLFIGGVSLHIKRFHDRGKSGWWVLVFLIPVIGFIWMIVEMGILEGDAGIGKTRTAEELAT